MASSCFFSAALFTASIKSMTNGGAVLGHGLRASTSAFWSEPVPWFSYWKLHETSHKKWICRWKMWKFMFGFTIPTVSLKLTVCKKGILKMETWVQFNNGLGGNLWVVSVNTIPFRFYQDAPLALLNLNVGKTHEMKKRSTGKTGQNPPGLLKLFTGCLMFLFWNQYQDFYPTTGAPPLGQVTPSRMSHDISWTPSETRKIDGNVHHQYKRILWIPWWTWKPVLP